MGLMTRLLLVSTIVGPARCLVGRGARAPQSGRGNRRNSRDMRGGRGARFTKADTHTDNWSLNAYSELRADDEELDAVYGVSSVLAALRSSRRDHCKLLLQESISMDKRSDRPALLEVEQLAVDAGIPIERRDKGSLNSMCGNRPHQGLVLLSSRLEFEPLLELPIVERNDAPVWVALDEVTDPQNFGALIRSAFFLGASGVLVSQKNSCPLTPGKPARTNELFISRDCLTCVFCASSC